LSSSFTNGLSYDYSSTAQTGTRLSARSPFNVTPISKCSNIGPGFPGLFSCQPDAAGSPLWPRRCNAKLSPLFLFRPLLQICEETSLLLPRRRTSPLANLTRMPLSPPGIAARVTIELVIVFFLFKPPSKTRHFTRGALRIPEFTPHLPSSPAVGPRVPVPQQGQSLAHPSKESSILNPFHGHPVERHTSYPPLLILLSSSVGFFF